MGPGAWAEDGQAYLERAKAYLSKGNFSAAEIELRKAKREAPKDANIRALLARFISDSAISNTRSARPAPPAT